MGVVSEGVKRQWRTLKKSTPAYYALVLTLFVGGLLLLVLPAELITWKAEERPTIDLNLTFGGLKTQGWMALAFTGLAFLMMVTDWVQVSAHARCDLGLPSCSLWRPQLAAAEEGACKYPATGCDPRQPLRECLCCSTAGRAGPSRWPRRSSATSACCQCAASPCAPCAGRLCHELYPGPHGGELWC